MQPNSFSEMCQKANKISNETVYGFHMPPVLAYTIVVFPNFQLYLEENAILPLKPEYI